MRKRAWFRPIAQAVLVIATAACSGDEKAAIRCPSDTVKIGGVCESRFGSVAGTLKLAAGASPAGATVALLGTDRIAAVAEDGAFAIRDVPPGTYTLEARAPGHEPARRDGIVVAERERVEVPALELAPIAAPELRGRVTLSDGADPIGAVVGVENSPYATVVNGSGEFHLPLAAPGTYTVVARLPGYRDARIPDVQVVGPVELAPVQLALATGGVSGTFQLEGAASHAGITVFVEGTAHVLVTGADGAFAFERIEPGPQTVAAMRDGYATTRIELDVAAGEMAHLGSFSLAPAAPVGVGTVTGTARLLGARSHEGISVRLEGGPEVVRIAITDAAGGYRFGDVPAGAYRLEFRFEPFQAASIDGLVVEPGELSAPAITLRRSVPIDERPLKSIEPAGSSRMIVQFDDGADPALFALALADGTRTRLSAGSAEPLAVAADGAHALLSDHGRVVRVDLATGERIPVSPRVDGIVLVEDAGLWYRTHDGDLWFVAADAVDGLRAYDAPSTEVWYFPEGSSLGGHPQLVAYAPGQYSRLVLLAETARAIGPIGAVHQVTADHAIVELTGRDASPASTLARIDFASGDVTPLAEDVSSVFQAPDGSWMAFVQPGPDGSHRLSILDPATGALDTLVEDFVGFVTDLGDHGLAVVAGRSLGLYVIRFDRREAALACDGARWYWLTEDDGFYCQGIGAGSAELAWFDFTAGSRRVIAHDVDGVWPIGTGRTVVWSERNEVHAATRAAAFAPRPLGAAGWQAVLAYSADGSELIDLAVDPNTYEATLAVLDVASGDRQPLLPGMQALTQWPDLTCRMSPGGETAMCFYTFTDPGDWSCPSGTCLATLDVDLASRHLAPAAAVPAGDPAWSPNRRTALFVSGGRAYHVVRSEAGVPALIEGASVPADALPLAVGDGGLHGLAGTPGGRRYFGVSTSDRSGRPFDVTNDGPFRVASSHWLIGDRLLDLATGRALPLGDDVRGITFAADRASFLFQAGAEGDLYRWNAADGVQPVARLAIPWPAGAERLWITGYDGAAGDLERIDPATGDRMRLLSGFQRTLGTMGDGRSVMISGFEPNLGMGKLVALDLSTGHVEGLSEIRATLPAYGIGERLIFHGLDGGRPAIRTLSFGTGTVARVGPGELGRVLSITPDGRLMYEANGIWWAEGRDGAPAMAIDFADAERTSAVTGDGSHVLYDRAGEGTFGVEL